MNWIDCKEQLPRKGQMCLIYRPDAVKTQDSLYRVAIFTGEHFACYVQPSHWVALTSPLKRRGLSPTGRKPSEPELQELPK